jgi:hypothetical protein
MGTTWDSGNKSASITLYRNALNAASSASPSTWKSVKGTSSQSSGKFVIEFYVSGFVQSSNGIVVGFGNSTATLASYAGSDSNSFSYQPDNGATNGITGGWAGGPDRSGVVVQLAIDLGAKLVWGRNDLQLNWNNNGAADPATGTGGYTYGVTGALFPMGSVFDGVGGDNISINAGFFTFFGSLPSGFSAWDTGAVTVGGIGGTSGPTTWNPSDKDSHVALSGGNLAATQSEAGNFDGVRSTSYYTGGQVYWENIVTNQSDAPGRGWLSGVASSATAVTHNFPGGDLTSSGVQTGDERLWFMNGGSSGLTILGTSVANGDVIAFAMDVNKGLIWAKDVTQSGNWNGNALADPVTGVGGMGIQVHDDNVYIMWSGEHVSSINPVATLNVGATLFVGTKPTGYIAWDAPATLTTAWSPIDKGSTITLSNSNLTATAGGTPNAIRSTTSHTTGKFYVEFDNLFASNNFTSIGAANATAPVSSIPNTNNSADGFNIGQIYVNGSNLGSWGGSPAPNGGMAIDLTSQLMWWCSNVTASPQAWNGSTSNAPGGAGGISITGLGGAGTPVFIYAILQSAGEAFSVNFGASAFVAAVPAGYIAWDGSSTVLSNLPSAMRRSLRVR